MNHTAAVLFCEGTTSRPFPARALPKIPLNAEITYQRFTSARCTTVSNQIKRLIRTILTDGSRFTRHLFYNRARCLPLVGTGRGEGRVTPRRAFIFRTRFQRSVMT